MFVVGGRLGPASSTLLYFQLHDLWSNALWYSWGLFIGWGRWWGGELRDAFRAQFHVLEYRF